MERSPGFSVFRGDLARFLSLGQGQWDLALAELNGHVTRDEGLGNLAEVLMGVGMFDEVGGINLVSVGS